MGKLVTKSASWLKAVTVPTAALAVRVEPFSPKETPFEFAKVIAETLLLVVPALTLIATDAVNVETSRPNETPFEFANVKAEARFDVVPALRLTLPCIVANDAVTTLELLIPNDTPFESEKMIVPVEPICVPAASAFSAATRATTWMLPKLS